MAQKRKKEAKIRSSIQSHIVIPLLPSELHKTLFSTRTITYSFAVKLCVTFLSILVIFFFKTWLDQHIPSLKPHVLLFLVAVIVSSWFGGFQQGIVATIMCTFLISYYFLPPYGFFKGKSLADFAYLGIFVFEGILMATLSQIMHTALLRSAKQKKQLERSQEVLRLIVQTVKDYAIYTLDEEGYVTSWNEGAQNIKLYSVKEVIGKHFSLFYPKEDVGKGKPWADLAIATAKGRYEGVGLRIRKDQTTFWANEVITAIRDEKHKLFGFSVITRDMTTEKELDERKNEFISMASHELKTPITSMSVFASVLEKQLKNSSDHKLQYYVSRIKNQINKQTSLINDLLDVSRIQTGRLAFTMEYFDLNALVKETIDIIQATSSKHRIQLEGSIKQQIYGDRERIGQVLINLLTNAVKYSPDADKVLVNVSKEGNSVKVCVKDFGIGIAKKHIDKIFNRFYRVQDSNTKVFTGLGIGLYIASEIVNQHKGNLWATSEEKKGSEFCFRLPLPRNSL